MGIRITNTVLLLAVLLLSGIALELRRRLPQQLGKLGDSTLYMIATLVAGVYVVAQEVKLHSFGGNNTYDPYDVAASIVGLVVMNRVITTLGMERRRGGIGAPG